jgi:hypothetical protein
MVDGKAISDGTSYTAITYNESIFNAKRIRVKFEIKDYVSGTFRVPPTYRADGLDERYSGDGQYQIEYNSISSIFAFQGQLFNGSIDNVSVKEVGQNWTFFGEAEFTENGARIYSSSGGQSYISQAILTNTKKYRLSYEITDSTTGSLKLINVNGLSDYPIPSTVGTHTLDFIANNNTFFIYRNSGATDVTIDNISVIEVTDDTDLPRINYTNFSYEDVLGDELVTNGSFDTDSDWSKGTGWTIANGRATSDASANSYLNQQVYEIGKKYKLNFEVLEGTIELRSAQYSQGIGFYSTGTYSIEVIPTTTSTYFYVYTGFGQSSIDNVSVKELTENVVVPYSGEGSLLLENQSTNKVTYSEDFSQWSGNEITTQTGFLAPDGSNNAIKITSTGSQSYFVLSGLNLTGTDTRTIYAKTVSGTGTINLCSYGQNTNNNFTITPQWQRFEVNGTTTATGEPNFYGVDFRFAEANPLSELIIWGAQAEALSYATSYIPTNGSTHTNKRKHSYSFSRCL